MNFYQQHGLGPDVEFACTC